MGRGYALKFPYGITQFSIELIHFAQLVFKSKQMQKVTLFLHQNALCYKTKRKLN